MSLVNIVSGFVCENDVQRDAVVVVVDWSSELIADDYDGEVNRPIMPGQIFLSGFAQCLASFCGVVVQVKANDVSELSGLVVSHGSPANSRVGCLKSVSKTVVNR